MMCIGDPRGLAQVYLQNANKSSEKFAKCKEFAAASFKIAAKVPASLRDADGPSQRDGGSESCSLLAAASGTISWFPSGRRWRRPVTFAEVCVDLPGFC